MQNSTKKMGRRTGTCNKEGNKAGGVRKGAGRKKTMQSFESEGELISLILAHQQALLFKSKIQVCNRISTFLSL
jgi:hypothetical protein